MQAQFCAKLWQLRVSALQIAIWHCNMKALATPSLVCHLPKRSRLCIMRSD